MLMSIQLEDITILLMQNDIFKQRLLQRVRPKRRPTGCRNPICIQGGNGEFTSNSNQVALLVQLAGLRKSYSGIVSKFLRSNNRKIS